MPRFSILLPTHNRPDVLSLAIESALAQTEPDFEVLVVGDGCTDHTAEVVAGFGDPRLRWFDLPKAPHFGYANRNVALRQARGDFIAFLAHDDLWLQDHLELLGEAIERTGAEWLYSLPLWVAPDGAILPISADLCHPDELESFMTVRNVIPAGCVLHRRSCLEKYGYWPEDVPSGGDWHLWQRIIEGGGRQHLAYLPVPTTLHFKAIRKTHIDDEGRHEAGTALQIARQAPWWPSSLNVAVPPGQSEQQAVWQTVKAGGAAYRAALRAGVWRVIERLARDAIAEQLRSIQALSGWVRRSLHNELPITGCPPWYPGGRSRFEADLAALRQSGTVNPAWYLATNPDVAQAGADPYWHYLVAGKSEGRRPCPAGKTFPWA